MLQDQAGNGPLVLFVDDLHLLDSTSATLVGQLVDADLVFLVGDRADERDACRRAWSRCGSGPGCAASTSTTSTGPRSTRCCTSCCGARSRRARVTEIWTASQGNVLFVRELVLGALDSGHLVDQRGVWRLVGPLVATPAPARAGRRPGSARSAPAAAEALDILAVWEPTGLSTLEAIGRAASRSRRSTAPGCSPCGPTAAASR